MASVRQTSKEYKELAQRLKDIAKAVEKNTLRLNDLNRTQKKVNKTSGVFDVRNRRNAQSLGLMGNKLSVIRSKMLLFNFAMAAGVRQLIHFSKEATRLDSMERAFTTLSGGVLNADIAMDKLGKATDGTMSKFDLFQQANNAMILGVSKNADEMAEMFDIAQRLGAALGRDTKTSVESLVTGIGRQSRLMLDNIGIIVKSEKAYQKLADELDINVDLLSDSQKKQAFLNATMEAARSKVAGLNPEIKSSQMIFQAYGASLANLQAEIGVAFLPLMESMAEVMTDIFDAIDADEIQRFATAVGIAGASFVILSGAISSAARALIAFNIAQTKTGWGILATLIGAAAFAAMEYFDIFEDKTPVLDESVETLSEYNDELERNKKLLKDAADKQFELEKSDILLVNALENKNEIQGRLNALSLESSHIQDLASQGLITAIEAQTRENNVALETEKLTRQLEESKRKQKLKTLSTSIMAISSLVALNKKNAKAAADIAAVSALVDAYSAAQSQYTSVSALLPPPFPQIAFAAAIAQGLAQAQQVRDAAKFEQGGLVGGRRHSQGGTMIEAEQGEFVMSRSAVQAVGIENLNRMNQGGAGSGITVNVSGNVMSQDYVEGELAEQIKEAIRRGNDFGVS